MARPDTKGIHPANSVIRRRGSAGAERSTGLPGTGSTIRTRSNPSGAAMGGKNVHAGKDLKTVRSGSNIKRRG